MNNIIRLCAYVNKINVANPQDCFLEIKDGLSYFDYFSNDIIVFPRLAFCSPSSGAVLHNSALLSEAKKQLLELAELTQNHKGYIIIGLPIRDNSSVVSALAVLYSGEVVALLPCLEDDNHFVKQFSTEFTSPDSIFKVGNCRFMLHTNPIDQLTKDVFIAAENGCQLYVVPCYEPMYAGKTAELKSIMNGLSKALNMAIVMVNGGIGDTSSPHFYNGFASIHENGKLLDFHSNFENSFSLTGDIDLDLYSKHGKTLQTVFTEPYHSVKSVPKAGFLRKLSQNPFLPEDETEKDDYLCQLFAYQVQSLVSRMENTGIDKLVVGVSGGIDSTVAMLVSVAACDFLGLPRSNIHGITLPGLGTSQNTYFNALAFLEALEVSRQDISIRASVLQHFSDISHTGELDTAYENAQARERTQILLDIANMVGGLMVGSGDLSEEALGFSTFGGDHLANYNVNSCVTKTVLQEILKFIIKNNHYPAADHILQDILDTVISPELLPPDDDGNITQKTEEILGSYVLHEFFLYYFIAHNMLPSKIFKYACHAFKGQLNDNYIKEKLVLFIRKFCANQFKRSCAPDSASITEFNLLGVNYYIPSDIDPTLLLNELENNFMSSL